MANMRAKLFVAGILVLVAVSYLALAGARSGWVYYLQVDEFLASDEYQQSRVRLCGRVSETEVAVKTELLEASFDLNGAAHTIPVVYRGVVPDQFKAGCEVVVEGKLDDQGVFQADLMLTKCASKYDAEDHTKRLESGQ